jgi:hypothetical protein
LRQVDEFSGVKEKAVLKVNLKSILKKLKKEGKQE